MNIFRSVSQNTVLTISAPHGDTESFRSPLFLSLALKPVLLGCQWITGFRKRPPAHQCLFGPFGVVYRYRRRYCCMKQARELGYSWAVVLVPHQGGRQEQDAALIELLDTLNIEKVYVLGASAGGTPAIRFALDDSERTTGIILLSSAPVQDKKPQKLAGRVGPASVVNRNYLI